MSPIRNSRWMSWMSITTWIARSFRRSLAPMARPLRGIWKRAGCWTKLDLKWPWVKTYSAIFGWLFTSINPIYFDVHKWVPWFWPMAKLPFPGRTPGFEAVPRGSSAAVRGSRLHSAGKESGDGSHSHTKLHNYVYMLHNVIIYIYIYV